MSDEHTKPEGEISPIAERETKTLEFWKKNKIFEKTLKKQSPKGEFVFYDGPPFATGSPHYGHLLAGTMKDVIPRFKTMQGYHVPRRWGWDTHGLPIENLIEKELGLKSKKDIEELGIEKFNDAARAAVLRYDHEWKDIVPRTGRFVDMDNAYLTMQPSYSESIWWSFKTLHEKNLIYNGFKSMMLCPHCGTTLSNFEVAQGYKDITDISVYVKFELVDEPGTFVLAWTTTPWTLPGNVALAVGPDIEYVKVTFEGGLYILAKERLTAFKDKQYEVKEELKGADLVGKKYKPVFDYYEKADLKNKKNAWKIVSADFVTTTDGTGVVHIAPAFGEDDYNLSLKENLPFIQHVALDGTFKKEVTDFKEQFVKAKDDHQKADIEIIKYLAGKGTLFAKEKLVHAYPHCWRCDTPLLNYATSSWFVKVTDLKEKLVAENSKVNWVPSEIGEGRFGKWLENARDWAISRSRYWGAPLPVWQNEDGTEQEIIGSIEDIKKHTKRNTYFVVRHGEAESNARNIMSGNSGTIHHLTEKGKTQVAEAASTLHKILKESDKNIDLIITSHFTRTEETAKLLAQSLNISEKNIVVDERIGEFNFGDLDSQPVQMWHDYWKQRDWKDVDTNVPGGESPRDLEHRIGEFLYTIDAQHQGKTILIVSHQDSISYMQNIAAGKSLTAISRDEWHAFALDTAEVRELDFAFIPHNRDYELDLHRPFIDEVTWISKKGNTMKRIPEVFDTWYESGSMPYSQIHYPFHNKELIDTKKFFPADFIAEGQDQTRGWFYSMLVLSTALFGESAYKNVIANGIVLAENGQKMSKRLKNYPEITYVLNKYGGDAMRFYLMNSPVVHAEDLSFSEKGVDDVVKKLILRLQNVYVFYATYAPEYGGKGTTDMHILDRWIVARLHELSKEVTSALEVYELDRGAKPFMQFVDDLSTWYVRRSRDRCKGDDPLDKDNALFTLKYVLKETAKLLAPYMPFLAEDIYLKLDPDRESVHLEHWPVMKGVDNEILKDMTEVRSIVSITLEARAKANIKVRQPLSALTIKHFASTYGKELIEIIKDEVNVKDVVVDEKIDDTIQLDTKITPELKHEGQAREFIRGIQELRKKMKFNPSDVVVAIVSTDDEGKKLIETFKKEISKTAQLKSIGFKKTEGEKVIVDEIEFTITLEK